MARNPGEFDLQPDPRILPMLGEINLAQWRCLAELVDNSIDGFLSAARRNEPVDTPTVRVTIPTSDSAPARVTVTDNGPGMAPDILENAMRAGWTGNNPISSLGMFGMGFNIATARLGTATTVWTTTKDSEVWHGLRIEFETLQRQRHFRTPHLTRGKMDPTEHGTEITIECLKPEQRLWLVRPANQNQIRQRLSEAYGSMLRNNGVPTSFALLLNQKAIPPRNHCVWDESRGVDTPRAGRVPAVLAFDVAMPQRGYCTVCWQWLAAGEEFCPACGKTTNVVLRDRRVHGWIGLQRYLSTSEFGIDFVRHGRKIEISNKDLFEWALDGLTEREYPIDDPRNRGRFVGEIHLDHCRVTYMKDRFDRTDPAWDEMVRIVRGDGPLRPEKAAAAGFGPNESPLYRLFQAYRRSSPQNARLAGGWARVLAVKDNDRAEEMAKQYHRGLPMFQEDTRWWELIVEEDDRLLTPPPTTAGPRVIPPTGPLPGFTTTEGTGECTGVPEPPPALPSPPTALERAPIPSLTREYRHDGTNLRWNVSAFSVKKTDPELRNGAPWWLTRRLSGADDFFVDTENSVFRSATMTELDALLCQLAWLASDFTRSQPDAPPFATILADLREKYASTHRLDPISIKTQAELVFSQIARVWPAGLTVEDTRSLFVEALDPLVRESIYARMAVRAVGNPQHVIDDGRFLEFASPRAILSFILAHPELFFDGRCWDDAYSALDFPAPAATDEARRQVTKRYESLLLDAVWLTEQEPYDLAQVPRARLIRSALAVELLIPITPESA